VVVESCYDTVVRGLVEHFAHLLKKGFAVELGGANESILSKQNVFTLESGVEVFVEKVKGLVVSPV
jgi:hypothetical protein